jgi:hypothetical protein
MSEHLADTNVGNIGYVRKQDAVDALEETEHEPWYLHKDLEWMSGVLEAKDVIKSLEPAAVLPYTIDPDGTLTITVPKGTTVNRVLVQEDGTQWGGLFYAD